MIHRNEIQEDARSNLCHSHKEHSSKTREFLHFLLDTKQPSSHLLLSPKFLQQQKHNPGAAAFIGPGISYVVILARKTHKRVLQLLISRSGPFPKCCLFS